VTGVQTCALPICIFLAREDMSLGQLLRFSQPDATAPGAGG